MNSFHPLVQALRDHPLGLCGERDAALTLLQIQNMERRLNVLTFGLVMDKRPLDQERWSLLVGLQDHWLFDPSQSAYRSSALILDAFRREHIPAPQYTARVWWQICRGVQGRTKGSWRDLLRSNDDDAHLLQKYLHENRTAFPVLSGPVISALWLDLVHRVGGVPLKNWETLIAPLSKKHGKFARLFGVTTDDLHPIFANALNIWERSCQRLHSEACGLAECPRR